MKRHIYYAVLAVLFSTTSIVAQTTYSFQQIPYAPDPIAGVGITIGTDDIYSPVINLPFTFEYFGTPYNQVVIGSNGVVSFDIIRSGMFNAWAISTGIPGNVELKNSIAAPYHDIDPSISGDVQYIISGVAPYRRLMVSWEPIPMFSCTALIANSQVILYETTNIIEVHIANKPLCATWNNGVAILGIQDSTGTIAYCPPNRNYPTQWVATNESWRFCPNGVCNLPSPSVIEGTAYVDLNQDCQQDSTESGIANRVIVANNGDFFAYTDSAGHYTLDLPYSTTYTVQQYNSIFYDVLPCNGSAIQSVTFSASDTISNINFADTVPTPYIDNYIDIGTSNFSRCMTEYVMVSFGNNGALADSNAVINIHLPDSITLLNSSVPFTNLGGGNYSYAYNGVLTPGSLHNIALYVQIGCDTVGSVYCIDGSISSGVSEINTTDNTITECNQLIASYDPNDLTVASQQRELYGYVRTDSIDNNDTLDYRIRFHNAGSDTAKTVIIKHNIPASLDINTLQLGASSHPYYWYVDAYNTLVVRFEDIDLPYNSIDSIASHGFVKFSISQTPNNPVGTDIQGTSRIFFDFNPPIVTNTSHNIIPFPANPDGTSSPNSNLNVSVYPNPFSSTTLIHIDGYKTPLQLSLMDAQGRVVKMDKVMAADYNLNASGLTQGLYFWQLVAEDGGIATGKVILQY